MNAEQTVENLNSYVRTHDIDEKMKEKDDLDIKELLKAVKSDLMISEKLVTPKYRRGGLIGKVANKILDRFFRISRKIFIGSFTAQDSINFALTQSVERLEKRIESLNREILELKKDSNKDDGKQ